MGKWMKITRDFDRSLVIKKIRNTTNHHPVNGYESTGFFTEKPNISLDGINWSGAQGEQYGYGTENRFNLYYSNFCSRYYNFVDVAYSSTTAAHTTLVSGETYEFVCPVDMYWGGLSYPSATSGFISDCFEVYVVGLFSLDKENISFSATGGTDTVTLDSESPWTATTTSDWITLSQYSGETGAEIMVSVSSLNFEGRSGTIEFTDGQETITLQITQLVNTVIPLGSIWYNGNRLN